MPPRRAVLEQTNRKQTTQREQLVALLLAKRSCLRFPKLIVQLQKAGLWVSHKANERFTLIRFVIERQPSHVMWRIVKQAHCKEAVQICALFIECGARQEAQIVECAVAPDLAHRHPLCHIGLTE
eukprot:1978726-Pleurochrysis_carterae.AAC.1